MRQLLLVTLSLLACSSWAGEAPKGCKAGQSNFFVSYNFNADLGPRKVTGFGSQIICATAEQMETAAGIGEAREALESGLAFAGRKAKSTQLAILFFKQLKN